jgi:hypothetical protein
MWILRWSHAVSQALQTRRHEKCTKSKSCPRNQRPGRGVPSANRRSFVGEGGGLRKSEPSDDWPLPPRPAPQRRTCGRELDTGLAESVVEVLAAGRTQPRRCGWAPNGSANPSEKNVRGECASLRQSSDSGIRFPISRSSPRLVGRWPGARLHPADGRAPRPTDRADAGPGGRD